MASTDASSSQHRGTDKMFCGSASIAPTRSSLSSTQARLLAYQLGSISRSKIEKEASKTAPRLNKLVGHATIFDNAARFIIQHINDSITELDHMEPITMDDELQEEELWFGGLAGLDNYAEIEAGAMQVSFETTPHASFHGYAQLNAKEACNIGVTTTILGVEDGNVWDAETESSMDPNDIYGYLDRGRWIDTCCEGGECKVQPGWELSDACSGPVVSSTIIQESRDDDYLLWSPAAASLISQAS